METIPAPAKQSGRHSAASTIDRMHYIFPDERQARLFHPQKSNTGVKELRPGRPAARRTSNPEDRAQRRRQTETKNDNPIRSGEGQDPASVPCRCKPNPAEVRCVRSTPGCHHFRRWVGDARSDPPTHPKPTTRPGCQLSGSAMSASSDLPTDSGTAAITTLRRRFLRSAG